MGIVLQIPMGVLASSTINSTTNVDGLKDMMQAIIESKIESTLINSVSNVALLMIPLILTINVGWQLATGLYGKHRGIVATGLFQTILMYAVLLSYQEILSVFTPILKALPDEIYQQNDAQLANEVEFWSIGTFSVANLFRAFLEGINAMSIAIMNSFTMVYIIFLKTVGPLAIAFSLIPTFEGIFKTWVQKIITAYCWLVTLRILDAISSTIYVIALEQNGNGMDADIIVVQTILTVMYLLTPFLTSAYIGSSAAGAFMSKVFGIISATTLGATKALGKK